MKNSGQLYFQTFFLVEIFAFNVFLDFQLFSSPLILMERILIQKNIVNETKLSTLNKWW